MTETERILSLPRRTYDEQTEQQIIAEVSRQLGYGTALLRRDQAIALYELATQKGLFGALRVGAGKTLITLLAPTVLDVKRPVLLLPAALIGKTEREREVYAKDWKVSKALRIMSYEMLGRTNAATWLESQGFDLVISDECHRLKNPRAAVSRRVARYMQQCPQTLFVALSGTVVRKSLKDYAHLLRWSLKDKAPVPLDKPLLEEWADVLDDNENFLVKKNYAAMRSFGSTVDEIRESYAKRLIETPGVVFSKGSQDCNASILVQSVSYDIDPITIAHFKKLREEWVTPDNIQEGDPMAVWRHCRELSLGMHYRWNPPAPQEWKDKRAEWCRFCRQIITYGRKYDSEKQVADAIQAGQLKDEGQLASWLGCRDSFTPNTEPVWHSDFALQACQRWIENVGGVVWTVHSFFGRELSRRTGLRYFGEGGLDENGQAVEDTRPDKDGSIIVSLQANKEGRNLQAWNTGLVTCPPSGGDQWEQLIGRFHRQGQKADEVRFDVFCGAFEHIKSMNDALKDARMIYATTKQEQKLLYCDLDYPLEVTEKGANWGIDGV